MRMEERRQLCKRPTAMHNAIGAPLEWVLERRWSERSIDNQMSAHTMDLAVRFTESTHTITGSENDSPCQHSV
jgi:hypothetical protein